MVNYEYMKTVIENWEYPYGSSTQLDKNRNKEIGQCSKYNNSKHPRTGKDLHANIGRAHYTLRKIDRCNLPLYRS